MNEESLFFCPEEKVNNEAGHIDAVQNEPENIRKYNIGNSNYSKMPVGYQPWDI